MFDEVGGCIMWPRPICLSFLLHGPTTDFWSGPTFQILFVFYAGLNGQSLHVGSHVLCWVMYVVARRAEIAVDHIKLGQYLGRGAWKLRQRAQRIHTFLLEIENELLPTIVFMLHWFPIKYFEKKILVKKKLSKTFYKNI